MRNNWREKWRLFWLHSIPFWTTLVLIFIFLMPVNSVKWGYFRPNIGLICVYYWSLRRGYLFGYFSAFLLGLLIDVYSSSPLGINILLLLITVAISSWLAHYFQSSTFGLGWLIFGLTIIGITLIKWLALMVYFGQIISIKEVLMNYLSTVLFYPLIVSINVWVQRFLPQERINE